MNEQGAVTIRTDFKNSHGDYSRSCSHPMNPGGNARFNVVEFDRVIDKMVLDARQAMVKQFGEPEGYQGPESVAECKAKIALLEIDLEVQKAEVNRLKKELDIRPPDHSAGRGTANEWYQGISSALGVGAGGLNVNLEDCKELIEILKERSAALRQIEAVQKGRFGRMDATVDGKPI